MTVSFQTPAALTPGKLWGLRRMADAEGRFKMLAVDQRPPIKARCAAAREEAEARYEDVRAVKQTLMKVLGGSATATLADPHYALSDALTLLPASAGLIGTIEDSNFVETDKGRISREIDNWSVDQIKRVGCDGVKVLTWYRPDADESILSAQRDFSKRVGEACAKHDIPYVFELLLYPLPGDAHQTTDYVEQIGKRGEQVVESVRDFAGPEYGVDLFKLESPIAAADILPLDSDDQAAVERTRDLYEGLNEAAGRPWVMLSAGATQEKFRTVLDYAFEAGASGFLAGRAIWWKAFNEAFPDRARFEADLTENGLGYFQSLNSFADEKARPWTDWYTDLGPTPGGQSLRFDYPGQIS